MAKRYSEVGATHFFASLSAFMSTMSDPAYQYIHTLTHTHTHRQTSRCISHDAAKEDQQDHAIFSSF